MDKHSIVGEYFITNNSLFLFDDYMVRVSDYDVCVYGSERSLIFETFNCYRITKNR